MKPHEEIAVAFAQSLVDGDFRRAQSLLAPRLAQTMSADHLREKLHDMYRGYAPDDAPRTTLFHGDVTMEDWPDKLPGDVGWSYVGILGEEFVEAVTVTVADIDGDLLIRKIEWGRP